MNAARNVVRDLYVPSDNLLSFFQPRFGDALPSFYSGDLEDLDTADNYGGPAYVDSVLGNELVPLVVLVGIFLGLPAFVLLLYVTVWPSLGRVLYWIPNWLDKLPEFVGFTGARLLGVSRTPITLFFIIVCSIIPVFNSDVEHVVEDVDFALQRAVVDVSAASDRIIDAHTRASRILFDLNDDALNVAFNTVTPREVRLYLAEVDDVLTRISYMRQNLSSFIGSREVATNWLCIILFALMIVSHLLLKQYLHHLSLPVTLVGVIMMGWLLVMVGVHNSLHRSIDEYCTLAEEVRNDGYQPRDERLAPAFWCGLESSSGSVVAFIDMVSARTLNIILDDAVRTNLDLSVEATGATEVGDDVWEEYVRQHKGSFVVDLGPILLLRSFVRQMRQDVEYLDNCIWVRDVHEGISLPVEPVDDTIRKNVYAVVTREVHDDAVCDRLNFVTTVSTLCSLSAFVSVFQVAWTVIVASRLSFTVEG